MSCITLTKGRGTRKCANCDKNIPKEDKHVHITTYHSSVNICYNCLMELAIEILKDNTLEENLSLIRERTLIELFNNIEDVIIKKEEVELCEENNIEEDSMEIGQAFTIIDNDKYTDYLLVNKYTDPDTGKKGYVGLNIETQALEHWTCVAFFTKKYNNNLIIKESVNEL